MHRLVAVAIVLVASSLGSIRPAVAAHITSVSPSSGETAGGIPITIYGENFAAAGNSVMIGGSQCPVTAETPSLRNRNEVWGGLQAR